jgi:hypothetical protein
MTLSHFSSENIECKIFRESIQIEFKLVKKENRIGVRLVIDLKKKG